MSVMFPVPGHSRQYRECQLPLTLRASVNARRVPASS